ncbi:MAG: OmpA family protein [Deltaproteobacteria bacterium]|nr:OmpA family protein [Deltaproteobacteria bacterium]
MQRLLLPTLAFVVSAFVARPAFAQDSATAARGRRTSFNLEAFAGGHYFAEGTNLGVASAPEASAGARGNALLGLRASLGLGPWVAAEVEFLGMMTTDRTYGRRAGILGYRLNALAYLMSGNLRPFLVAGAGVVEVADTRAEGKAGLVRDRDGEVHVGGGLDYRLLDHLALRGDVRFVHMPGKQAWSLATDFEATLGVVLLFGAGPRAAGPSEARPAVAGPPASETARPAPAAAAQASPKAAPSPVSAVSPAKAAPLPGSGAPAPKTEEPPASPPPVAAASLSPAPAASIPVSPTSAPTPVTSAAVAPASASIVPTAKPAFAGPKPAAAGATRLPPVKKLIGRAREIRFEGRTSKLSIVSLPLLGQLAEALVKEPGIRLEIVSHTAGGGDAHKELALSRRRAEAVKKALMQREVEGSRLTTVGRGSEVPLAPSITRRGRQLNERTELRLVGADD